MEQRITVKINKLTFPDVEEAILHDIDFTVNKGDFVAVTGSVAAGKSSLLHCITGAIPKYHQGNIDGSVTIMGENIEDIPLPKMSERVGYMTQDPQSQIIDVNVYEDVAFGIGNQELSKEEMDSRIKNALAFVGLSGFENRHTDALSGGQAQRVVLAGVLAMNLAILVLDQPTAELDPKGRRDLYEHLAKINKEKGITIIMVMDRSEEVLERANRIFVMEKGTITAEMKPEQWQKQQKRTAKTPTFTTTVKETAVNIKGASHIYKGGYIGCNPLNLTIEKGEFVSVVGLNGSGKTTLLKMIEGLLPPSQGSVEIFGETMGKKTATSLRKRMGFLFQNPDYQIFSDTVLKEVTFSLKLQKCPEKEMEAKGLAALDAMGLLPDKDKHPQMLSRGQRQLLALASVLINDPELLIADEPTSGLDEAQSHLIMEKLAAFAAAGKTVLLVSHDLEMAKTYSHRMIAMAEHNVVADFATESMLMHKQILINIGLQKEVIV